MLGWQPSLSHCHTSSHLLYYSPGEPVSVYSMIDSLCCCSAHSSILKGTLFHGIFYSAQSPLVLRAFSDADWAGDPTNRRSTTGYCFLLASSLISWQSKKQTHVARSSIEAEYCALVDTTSELLWLRWLLKDLGVSTSSATPLYLTTRVPFILLTMMSSMNGLNTSRSIIILFVISLSMVLSS